MSNEHTHPTRPLPRVDPPEEPAPARRSVSLEDVLSAVSDLAMSTKDGHARLDAKIDARVDGVESRLGGTETRLDTKIDISNEQIRSEMSEKFAAADTARTSSNAAVHKLADRFTTLEGRVGKLEDDGKRPSAPPRTASGMVRLAQDVAKGTKSEVDKSLEAAVGQLVANDVEQNKILAAHSHELAAQTLTLRSIQTSSELAAENSKSAARAAEKQAAWHHHPLFQQVVLILAVAVSAYIATRTGAPVPLPLPH